ncbi:LmrA/YxaF family transcription factor, partial [Streptomyces sp. NPDC054912]
MIRVSGTEYGRMVPALLESVPDPMESLVHAFEAAADDLAAADYADACPIGTVALEVASSNEVLRIATAEVFEEWVGTATRWFGRWVAEPRTAQSLAYSMVMMLEGAFMGRPRPGTIAGGRPIDGQVDARHHRRGRRELISNGDRPRVNGARARTGTSMAAAGHLRDWIDDSQVPLLLFSGIADDTAPARASFGELLSV